MYSVIFYNKMAAFYLNFFFTINVQNVCNFLNSFKKTLYLDITKIPISRIYWVVPEVIVDFFIQIKHIF